MSAESSSADAKAPLPSKAEEIVSALESGEISQQQALEAIEKLPQDQSRELVQELVISMSYKGPIPSPQMLEHYNGVLPGLAARIVDAWEGETAHRRQLETKIADGESQSISRGQYLGMLGLIAILATTVILANAGHSAVAIAVAGMGVAGIIGAIVKGRNGS